MDPWGHEYLTNEAVKEAVKDFPPSLNWVRYFLRDTNVGAVYRDTEDVLSRGHWTKEGQRHHFMRFRSDTLVDAYKDGVDWISDNAHQAAQHLREIWQQNKGYVHPVYINQPLGYALHALQDSYSAGHVLRKKINDTYVIVDILVYDEANKKKTATWPGHAALDERWKTDDLGKEAVVAGRELIRIVVRASLVKNDVDFEPKWNSLWQTFASLFLVRQFQASTGR